MKKLLVVVDYQVDFVNGSLGFAGAELLEEPICRKIEAYRAARDEVVFTYDTHGSDYLQTQEGRNLPVVHCEKDCAGWQLFGKVEQSRRAEDKCFYKPSFGSMELAEYVRERKYDAVEVCGLVSSICVISNAVLIKAALPEAVVEVDAQCVAGGDRVLHEKALDVMAGLQIKVLH